MNQPIEHSMKFKELMGNYPTGVTIVTAVDDAGTPVGLTVNSFASVSMDPMLVLWSIDDRASTFPVFMKADKFNVNILAADQADLVKVFTTKGINRFDHCEWEMSDLGLPVLANTAGSFQCKVHQRVKAGDHVTMIGEVLEIHSNQKPPLLYHKRNIGPIPEEFYK